MTDLAGVDLWAAILEQTGGQVEALTSGEVATAQRIISKELRDARIEQVKAAHQLVAWAHQADLAQAKAGLVSRAHPDRQTKWPEQRHKDSVLAEFWVHLDGDGHVDDVSPASRDGVGWVSVESLVRRAFFAEKVEQSARVGMKSLEKIMDYLATQAVTARQFEGVTR